MQDCKAKKFQDRMDHRGGGMSVGEKVGPRGVHGKSAGEVKMGNMTKELSAKKYSHSQSKDGNGGK